MPFLRRPQYTFYYGHLKPQRRTLLISSAGACTWPNRTSDTTSPSIICMCTRVVSICKCFVCHYLISTSIVLHVYHSFVQLCFVQRGRAGEIHDTCIGLIEGEIFPLYLAVPKNAYCFAACAQIDPTTNRQSQPYECSSKVAFSIVGIKYHEKLS